MHIYEYMLPDVSRYTEKESLNTQVENKKKGEKLRYYMTVSAEEGVYIPARHVLVLRVLWESSQRSAREQQPQLLLPLVVLRSIAAII